MYNGRNMVDLLRILLSWRISVMFSNIISAFRWKNVDSKKRKYKKMLRLIVVMRKLSCFISKTQI